MFLRASYFSVFGNSQLRLENMALMKKAVGSLETHLCNQIIGQSADVLPGSSFIQIHLCLYGNRQKLRAENLLLFKHCCLIVGPADGAHLRRPGLPGQPTQRLGVTDVIGLLHQRPTVHLRLNGSQAHSGHDRHAQHTGTGDCGPPSPVPQCSTPPRNHHSWQRPDTGNNSYFSFLFI